MFSFCSSLRGVLLVLFCVSFLSIAQAAEDAILKPTVVTASRTEQIVTDVIAHTTVLGRDAIEQSQLIDLPSLLAREAGFQFTQNGGRGTAATAFLRGAASLQVLVLIDGVPITKQDTTGSVSLEHIMLDQVDRIEIVRGNVSAVYGSGAIGGVIQVFTKDTQTQPASYVKAEIGSYGSRKSAVGTQGKLGDWQYALSAGNNSTRGTTARVAVQGVNINPDNDGYRNDSYSFNLSYSPNVNNKLGLRSTSTNGRFDYDVSSSFAGPKDINYGSTKIQSNTLYWNSAFSSQWKSKLTISDASEVNTATTLGLNPFNSNAKTHTQLLSWMNEFPLSFALITAGVDSQIQEIKADDNYGSSLAKHRNANALYAGILHTQEANSFQFNVRQDSVQDTSSKSTSYLGYGRALAKGWKLSFSHATAFNVAPLGYLYDTYSGNPKLKPETSSTNEVGLQWAVSSHVVRSTFFSTKTKNLLLYDLKSFKFDNISSIKNEGLETTYSGRFDATDVRSSLTLQNPIDESTGKRLVRRAQTLASVSVSHLLGSWTLGGGARFTGARPDTASNPGLTSYVLIDATARYRLTNDWVVHGRIENLTDKAYQTAYGYNQLPRTFYMGATWNLKH